MHVRLALAAKVGIGRIVAEGAVPWEAALLEAVPFQAQAASTLGGALQGIAALRGAVFDTRIAITNALDWGESEIIGCVAQRGYGSPSAVQELDCRTLAGSDAVDHLVASYPDGLGLAESVSRLAGLLNATSSGVLLFRSFDEAHPAAQRYLLEGLARGRFSDARGRTLHSRTFTSIFLVGTSQTAGTMGLRRNASATPTPFPFAAHVHASIALERPPSRAIVDFVAPAVLAEFWSETGLELGLSESARCYLAGVSGQEGIAACRDRLRLELARCTGLVANVNEARDAAVEIGADSMGLIANLE